MQDKATLTVIPAILQLARGHHHPLTPAEAKIWARVRNRGLGFKIRRQYRSGDLLQVSTVPKQNWSLKSMATHMWNLTKKSMIRPEPNGWRNVDTKLSEFGMKTYIATWKMH